MFFIDEPYVSPFLKETIREYGIPVVATAAAERMELYPGTRYLREDEARELVRSGRQGNIYTNSENAIEWIAEHLAFSGIAEKINMFKNKILFRNLMKPVFPDFHYEEVALEDLGKVNFETLPLPCILKPAVGFFSMAVYKISSRTEWLNAVDNVEKEMANMCSLYPEEVFCTDTFIIEECIDGEEYAVDAYFNGDGKPVILNILHHPFSSGDDVSDRVYNTSREIIEENIPDVTRFLTSLGEAADIRDFPVHVEFRRNGEGSIMPIEVNPMRFGGWCTTADMAALAYGFNPYHYYYTGREPEWDRLLAGKEGKRYSIIVLDNSTGIPGSGIDSFDYEALLSRFTRPLELRRIDYRAHPVFGFLFAETESGCYSEIESILTSDLREFIQLR